MIDDARALAESVLGSDVWLRKPTVPEVLPLVRALYARHGAGCYLHCVLDDHNVEDEFVASTMLSAGAAEWCEDAVGCLRLAALLLRMSTTQRRKLARMKYAPPPQPAPQAHGMVTIADITRSAGTIRVRQP